MIYTAKSQWFRKARSETRVSRAGRRLVGSFMLLILSAGTVAPLPASAQAAEKFPSSAVTIVVPFPPGGSTDFTARTLGKVLADAWKVPVVIENKAGAAGNIAADFVMRAPADGHTLLLGAVSLVTNPALYKIPAYVPRVLTPIGVGVATQLVTVARPDLAAKDMQSLIAGSTSQGLNGASAGAGTLSHLGLELLVIDQKMRINHVPYRGSAPALADVMGGHADILIDAITSAGPAIASGKVKALAVHTPRRSPLLPNVATYEEQGLRGMTFGAWNIFVAPSGTLPERISALHTALSRAVNDPAVVKVLADRGLEVIVQSPQESLEFMRGESQRWEKVIRDANVKL